VPFSFETQFVVVFIMVLKIRKRGGEVVSFQKEKIYDAVQKAFHSVGVEDSVAIGRVTDDVVFRLEKNLEEDGIPSVELVQDYVEEILMSDGFSQVAKSYILYREKRREVRQKVKEGLIEKGISGKLNILKRNGEPEHFDAGKIRLKLERVSYGFEGVVSHDFILKELMKNIFEGIKAHEMDRALVLAVSSFIEKDPAYSYVAARLFLEMIYREVFETKINDKNFEEVYRSQFSNSIKKVVDAGKLDSRLLDFDLDLLSSKLVLGRDLKLQYMGVQTLYERYFIKLNRKLIETPQYFFMRVAMGLAINEENKNERAIEFYNVIASLRFMPSTPTLFHAGTTRPQLSSCYITTVGDDLENIFKSYSDNALLSKWSGGIGNDWTNVRATGAVVKGPGIESQGVIPFLKIANDVTAAINRSGRRRGATCAYLEPWHFDFEDFLDLRKNTGDDRRRTHDMNTAAWIPDLFMKRVEADLEWTLFSPHEVSDLHELYGAAFEKRYEEYEEMARRGEIRQYKVVSAMKLWRRMISMLFETGHPWITFKDPCNVRSPQDHVGVVHSSNLCTEITLNTSKDEVAVCNLGSVNLSSHVDSNGLDYGKLRSTIDVAIRMLDNVVDINFYPIPEARKSNLRHRPIGLGIMGLQDLFFKLNLAFDSPRALDLSDELMEHISYYAIKASSDLALERGSYSTFEGSKWDRGIFPIDSLELLEQERGEAISVSKKARLDWDFLKKYVKENGMRNSNVMAIAPTATISTISGCYPCFEPIYKNIYVKSNMSGEFTVINSYLVEDLKNAGLWNDEMIDKLKYYDGNLSRIAEIPIHLAQKYKESFDIDPMIAINHTALRTKWVDQSQSHNLFIKGTSGKLISDAYLYAWRMGLKTTYYLRSLGASQIEKSTLDAKKFGYTQKREYKEISKDEPQLCKINNPDCEACQ